MLVRALVKENVKDKNDWKTPINEVRVMLHFDELFKLVAPGQHERAKKCQAQRESISQVHDLLLTLVEDLE